MRKYGIELFSIHVNPLICFVFQTGAVDLSHKENTNSNIRKQESPKFNKELNIKPKSTVAAVSSSVLTPQKKLSNTSLNKNTLQPKTPSSNNLQGNAGHPSAEIVLEKPILKSLVT